jgi:hypothetical protein
MNSLFLPSLESSAADRAAAAAVQVGADLTLAMQAPAVSISSKTRSIETFSPLFRGSAANLQPGLFGDIDLPVSTAAPAVSIRHFSSCNGLTVELGEFGICPACGVRHRTERRVKFTHSAHPGECNAACMGATGPSCSCRCGGRNHGGARGASSESIDLFESED